MSDAKRTVVTIPASQIADQETFEQLRLSSPSYVQGSHNDLAFMTELTDGVSLHDRAIETALVQDESEEALAAAKSRAKKLVGETAITLYDIAVNTDDGYVSDITKRTILPEDKEATRKQRRMADRVGYGPKSNDLAFVNRRAVPRR